MNGVGEDFSTKGNRDRTALMLSHACGNYNILSIINSMCVIIFCEILASEFHKR